MTKTGASSLKKILNTPLADIKHFQTALRSFPGLNTCLYLVDIQFNSKLHPPPPKLFGSARV